MAHELDTLNGKTAFLSAREDAWHQLGTTLDSAFTAEDAMTQGYLGGWDVRKQPLWTSGADGSPLVIPGRYAVVRNNPFEAGQVDVLGTGVTESYHIVQNEAHAAFLNDLVDESGAHFETAGSLQGGRKTFLTMKLPGHINIAGVDPVENYIAAVNSHDGSMAFTLMVTPVRVVCANTMNLAFQSRSHIYRVRHTSGIGRNMTEVRQALDMTFSYLDGFQEQAYQLVNTTLTQSRFEEIIQAEYGASEDAPTQTVTRCENKIETMTQLFADAQTQDGIRDTAYAGLNALTEYADHFSPTRGQDRDAARARNALLEPGFKNRALELMMAQV